MEIVYKREAINDLLKLDDYISKQFHSSKKGKALNKKITESISLLKENPRMGPKLSDRFKLDTDLRYLIASKHIIFYSINEEVIEIIRILDSRRDYISILF